MKRLYTTREQKIVFGLYTREKSPRARQVTARTRSHRAREVDEDEKSPSTRSHRAGEVIELDKSPSWRSHRAREVSKYGTDEPSIYTPSSVALWYKSINSFKFVCFFPSINYISPGQVYTTTIYLSIYIYNFAAMYTHTRPPTHPHTHFTCILYITVYYIVGQYNIIYFISVSSIIILY